MFMTYYYSTEIVSPSLTQSEKLVPYIPLLFILVIGFCNTLYYSKMEVGTGLVMYGVY
jgi:hypothetical protein